jgi:queuine tRNA-ribosyltransferase
VHHLLNAKEMLGWTLLQMHNHRVAADFFAGIRAVLARDGGEHEFELARRTFQQTYAPDLPAGTGTRPRARGYHFKSETGQAKYNKPQWGKYGAGEDGGEGEGKVLGTVEGMEA